MLLINLNNPDNITGPVILIWSLSAQIITQRTYSMAICCDLISAFAPDSNRKLENKGTPRERSER